MYKGFAETAQEEGFTDVARLFTEVGKIEKEHEDRYRTLVQNIVEGRVYSKETKRVWICRNCGHLHIGEKSLELCPVCNHPRSYMEVKADNYL